MGYSLAGDKEDVALEHGYIKQMDALKFRITNEKN
jgi:hypothetical protein